MGRGPLKARHRSNMQPNPQNKGGAKVTSMLCVTDNKPGLIPYSTKRPATLTYPGVALLVYHDITKLLLQSTLRAGTTKANQIQESVGVCIVVTCIPQVFE